MQFKPSNGCTNQKEYEKIEEEEVVLDGSRSVPSPIGFT